MDSSRMAGSVPVWGQVNPVAKTTTSSTRSDTINTAYRDDRMAGKQVESDLSFADILDVVNPLQHIPIVSTAYRAITGDEIKAPARIAGGALFGGPLGMASSLANVIIAEHSGKDIGEHIIAAFSDPEPSAIETAGTITENDIKLAVNKELPPMKPVTRMAFNS